MPVMKIQKMQVRRATGLCKTSGPSVQGLKAAGVIRPQSEQAKQGQAGWP